MNAAVKAVSVNDFSMGRMSRLMVSKNSLVLMVLLFLAMASAVAVIYFRGLARELTSQYESLQQENQELTLKHGQLMLEDTAWSTQARIQALAQSELNMTLPEEKGIVMVQK